MKRWQIVVLVVAIAVTAAGLGAYAATNYGGQNDPLVASSYLSGVLEPSLRADFDSQIAAAMEKLEQTFQEELASATGTFEVVTLKSGQSLSGGSGCEILFRSGTAVSVGSLIDVSTGDAVAAGVTLTANHLYMATDANSGLKASAAVTLLARGTYSVS